MTYVFAAHMLAAHCVAGSRSINMRCSRAHCASTVLCRGSCSRIFDSRPPDHALLMAMSLTETDTARVPQAYNRRQP